MIFISTTSMNKTKKKYEGRSGTEKRANEIKTENDICFKGTYL